MNIGHIGHIGNSGNSRKTHWQNWWLPLSVALVVLGLSAFFAGSRFGRGGAGGVDGFAAQVDLAPFGSIAVHTEGRLKSFDSFANGMVSLVSGPRKIAGQTPGFTYLDMLFRPAAYADADVIYVKNKPVRAQIAEALVAAYASAPESARNELRTRLDGFVETGLVSPKLLRDPALAPLIDRLQSDLIRTEKVVGAMSTAFAVMRPEQLLGRLRIVPPPLAATGPAMQPGSPDAGDRSASPASATAQAAGALDAPWHGIQELLPARGANGEVSLGEIEGLDPALGRTIGAQWADLAGAWTAGDAGATNRAIAALSETLPKVNPAAYPARDRLSLESWYFAVDNMSWVWLVYMVGVLPLFMWAVYRWPTALRIGLALFVVALLLQTTAVGVRWYVSGRWPNSNMFEAVTTASWFGACTALLVEILLRRSMMRGIFALAAAFASMTALMAAHFLPVYLNPNIGNMMPVLHDVWLYIHTNVIIFSYCLIFMAAVSAALYLGWRLVGGAPTYAKVGGAGSLIIPARADTVRSEASPLVRATGLRSEGVGAALLRSARTPALAGIGGAIVGGDEGLAGPGRHGGAATSPIASAATDDAALGIRRSPGEIFDGVTMVLMELSFVLLWTGIVMGAIWADHSWGRPWGWDPKEVFALNTFLVFAILVHVRLKVKDKGLWTAILALSGAGVMLFNWIVINFVIAGLHSYA
ncbi:MAG: cytochrome c biogenesis protein CcsA [Phycisphaerales bacterium]